jgi:hypothetical protein
MKEGVPSTIPGACAAGVGQPGDPEVRDLELAARRIVHDVGRLDVAMDDLPLVRVVQGIRNPCGQLEGLGHRQQLALAGVVDQVAAAQQLHGRCTRCRGLRPRRRS